MIKKEKLEVIKKAGIDVLDEVVELENSRNSKDEEKEKNIDLSTVFSSFEFEYQGRISLNSSGNNKDKEISIKLARNFKIEPREYIYSLTLERFTKKPKVIMLSEDILLDAITKTLKIYEMFGSPFELRFLVSGNKIYFFDIDEIEEAKKSTCDNDFVYGSLCTPYIYSLYNHTLKDFFEIFFVSTGAQKDTCIVKKEYARVCFNMSVIKNVLKNFKGYDEKIFNEKIGLNGGSEVGKNTFYGFSIDSFLDKKVKIPRNNMALFKLENEQYREYMNMEYEKMSDGDFFSLYKKVIDEFLKIALDYISFWYKSVVKSCILRGKVKKYGDFEVLFYHSIPSYIYDVCDITSKIKKNKKANEYFSKTDISNIYEKYVKNRKEEEAFDDISVSIKKYEYLSFDVLDVFYPHFDEDIFNVLNMFKEEVTTAKYSDFVKEEMNKKQKFKEALKELEYKTNKLKFRRLRKEIYSLRDLISYSEKLKDLLLKKYYVMYNYTLEFAKRINIPKDDIFFLSKDDIFEYMNKKKGIDNLNSIIRKNRLYYNLYKNFEVK